MTKTNKKKKNIGPYFIKNSSGKTTHVYLSLDTYERMMKKVDEYKKNTKRKGCSLGWYERNGQKNEMIEI